MTNAGPPRNPGLGPGDLEFRARGFRSVGIRVDRDRCLGLYRIWALTPGVRDCFSHVSSQSERTQLLNPSAVRL